MFTDDEKREGAIYTSYLKRPSPKARIINKPSLDPSFKEAGTRDDRYQYNVASVESRASVSKNNATHASKKERNLRIRNMLTKTSQKCCIVLLKTVVLINCFKYFFLEC